RQPPQRKDLAAIAEGDHVPLHELDDARFPVGAEGERRPSPAEDGEAHEAEDAEPENGGADGQEQLDRLHLAGPVGGDAQLPQAGYGERNEDGGEATEGGGRHAWQLAVEEQDPAGLVARDLQGARSLPHSRYQRSTRGRSGS